MFGLGILSFPLVGNFRTESHAPERGRQLTGPVPSSLPSGLLLGLVCAGKAKAQSRLPSPGAPPLPAVCTSFPSRSPARVCLSRWPSWASSVGYQQRQGIS